MASPADSRFLTATFLVAAIAVGAGQAADLPWLYLAGALVLALEFIWGVIHTVRHVRRVLMEGATFKASPQVDGQGSESIPDDSRVYGLKEHDWAPVTPFMFLQDAASVEGVLQDAEIPVKQVMANPAPYVGMAPKIDTAQVLVPKQFLSRALVILQKYESNAEAERQGSS